MNCCNHNKANRPPEGCVECMEIRMKIGLNMVCHILLGDSCENCRPESTSDDSGTLENPCGDTYVRDPLF